MSRELTVPDTHLVHLKTTLARLRDEVHAEFGSSDPLTRLMDHALESGEARVLRMAKAAYEAQRMDDEAAAAPSSGNWVFLTAPDGSRVRKAFSFGVFTDLPVDRLSELLKVTGLDAVRRYLGRAFSGGAMPSGAELAMPEAGEPFADPARLAAPAQGAALSTARSELDEVIERRGAPKQGSVLAAIEARLRELEQDQALVG